MCMNLFLICCKLMKTLSNFIQLKRLRVIKENVHPFRVKRQKSFRWFGRKLQQFLQMREVCIFDI